MDNVLTDDIVCIFTRSSSDTKVVGVSIRYFKSYATPKHFIAPKCYAVQTIKHRFD